MAFYRWWTERERQWMVIYLIASTLAPYFHLTTLPTVLSPFLLALADLVRRRWRGEAARVNSPGLTDLVRLGLTCALGLAVLLGPPLLLDWNGMAHRAGTSSVSSLTVRHALPLLAGVADARALAILLLIALAGGLQIARKDPQLAIYLLGVTLATIVPSVLSKAAALNVPIVFVRYNLWLVPLFLLLLARGFSSLTLLFKRRTTNLMAIAFIAVALFALGPLPAVYSGPNSWTNHAIYQYTYDENPFSYAPARRPVRISEFYRQLGEQPYGSLLIAEAPWFYEWPNLQLPYYQAVHHQWVKAGYLGALCRHPGENRPPRSPKLHLRNAVDISIPEALGMHGVDYVVLHKRPSRDFSVSSDEFGLIARPNIPWSKAILGCRGSYEDALGRPIFEDQDLVAFDVREFKTRDWLP
jgi:hypothetical protein